jgi:hypothetical protein
MLISDITYFNQTSNVLFPSPWICLETHLVLELPIQVQAEFCRFSGLGARNKETNPDVL